MRFQADPGPAMTAGAPGGVRRRNTLLVAVAVSALVVGSIAYGFLSRPSSDSIMTTSTYYNASPSSIISGVVQQQPAGYSLESAEGNPLLSSTPNADWAVFGQQDGSLANLTVTVFASDNTSQSYFARVSTGLASLPGYSDVSPSLSAYQQYGRCYGFGEDVDGIAVIYSGCTKGNVLLQTHLVSSKPFSDLQADMASLMGALYSSTA